MEETSKLQALMHSAMQRKGPDLNELRVQLPELHGVDDEWLRKHYGDLYDIVTAQKKCSTCTGYLNCWRDMYTSGVIYELRVSENRLEIIGERCRPFLEHASRVKRQGLLADFEIGTKESDQHLTFESYPAEQIDRHPELFGYMKDFAETFVPGQKRRGVYLYSETTGIGKTHLMYAVYNRLRQREIPVIAIRASEMVDKLRGARDGEIERLLHIFATVPVLCIDEFGQGYPTEFAISKLVEIIDARWSAALPTFATSNYRHDQVYPHLETKPEYVKPIKSLRSRLYELCRLAKMAGADNRETGLNDPMLPRW